MIKATELRIGNLIMVGKKIAKVNGSLLDYCDIKTEVPEFYPIPLTPEILEKAGFEKSEPPVSDQWYNHKINWAYYLNSGSLFIGCDNENGYEIPVKIKYVHQFQNIHFNLLGEELEINL